MASRLTISHERLRHVRRHGFRSKGSGARANKWLDVHQGKDEAASSCADAQTDDNPHQSESEEASAREECALPNPPAPLLLGLWVDLELFFDV